VPNNKLRKLKRDKKLILENLFKVEADDHREIQEQIRKNLRSLGYYVKLEKKVWTGREGKVDVFARKDNYSIGIEVDHSLIRKKSIEKLNALKPDLAIFLLKGKKINRKANYLRSKLIRVNSLLVHLPKKKVQKIPIVKQIYKKFERSKIPPKFKISETDLKILQDLANYRVLNTRHISALHHGVSKRTIQRRLKLLFHSGYVNRPIKQFYKYKYPSHIIYTLDRKGTKLLFPSKKTTKWRKKVKPAFLWHSLMISNFKVILTLALKNKSKSKLINWQEDNLTDRVYLEGERLPISPDAFFTIEDKDDLLHFFLEADRSTMQGKRFLSKMQAYWQWWLEEGHNKKFDISVFRVLTITISRKRKENLRKITKRADDRKQGSEMFLFTCQKDYNLKKPESILKQIWQSPKDNSWHHLLE
jgi:DNA-binding HxlR family transcriptional regulator